MWALPGRAGQATGIAEGTLKNRFWKGSWSHLPIPPHGTMKTLLIILHFSNILCAWCVWTPQFKVLCSVPGARFWLSATSCIMCCQSEGLTSADGPQSCGELGCSSREAHVSSAVYASLCWLVRKGKVSWGLKFSLWMQLLVTGSMTWEKMKGEL